MNLEIEIDSKQAVQLLLNLSYEFHPLASLISNRRSQLSSFADVKITHVARHQNRCADTLVKEGRKRKLSLWYSLSVHLQRSTMKTKPASSIPSQVDFPCFCLCLSVYHFYPPRKFYISMLFNSDLFIRHGDAYPFVLSAYNLILSFVTDYVVDYVIALFNLI